MGNIKKWVSHFMNDLGKTSCLVLEFLLSWKPLLPGGYPWDSLTYDHLKTLRILSFSGPETIHFLNAEGFSVRQIAPPVPLTGSFYSCAWSIGIAENLFEVLLTTQWPSSSNSFKTFGICIGIYRWLCILLLWYFNNILIKFHSLASWYPKEFLPYVIVLNFDTCSILFLLKLYGIFWIWNYFLFFLVVLHG